MLELRTLLWHTAPRLKGAIEVFEVRGDHAAALAGSEMGYIVADVWMANVNAQPTTAHKWHLDVRTGDGGCRNVAPVRRDDYWDAVRDDSLPGHTVPFPLNAVFPQNVGIRGWMYFPWNAFNAEIKGAVLVMTDAGGKQHRIKKT